MECDVFKLLFNSQDFQNLFLNLPAPPQERLYLLRATRTFSTSSPLRALEVTAGRRLFDKTCVKVLSLSQPQPPSVQVSQCVESTC